MEQMDLIRYTKNAIERYKNMESDLEWIIHNNCSKHGVLCGGALIQRVSASVFVIEKRNVDQFCENYFSYLDEETRKILSSALKSMFYTDGFIFTDKYVNITYGNGSVNKPITGGYYFMVADKTSNNSKTRTVLISLAQLIKQPSPNHYFLKDYYEGNEDRVENALKYMTYKDARNRIPIEGPSTPDLNHMICSLQ